jgi:hypothetical protein
MLRRSNPGLELIISYAFRLAGSNALVWQPAELTVAQPTPDAPRDSKDGRMLPPRRLHRAQQAQNGITRAFGRDQISGDDPRSRNSPNEAR